MVSIIKVTSVQDTSGNNETTTANIKKAFDGAAKSYVHFNGGGVSGSVSIYESSNKSSITDNATADFTVTATSAMNTTQYAVTVSANNSVTNFAGIRNSGATASLTTTTERYYSTNTGSAFNDANFVMSATFGDLA